jgi:N-acetylglucosamine kinase-like BadF-type ATPase
LLKRISEHWGLAGIEEVVAKANRVPGPDFAALTPVVLACAEEGDSVAKKVLAQAGRELADQAVLAVRKLRELEPRAPPPTLAVSGSILQRISPVRQAMFEFLHAEFPELEILNEPVDPLDGALWRARKNAENAPSKIV